MIRFEIDDAVFGIAEARRHLIAVDPQARSALTLFAEAAEAARAQHGHERREAQ